ncbi:dynamin family protein [Paenibacillus sp.]|uniref:dynamin family protein n=1 Tax=Paenibacillus sp. TaxID=58172 RepID=UPI0028123B17|nr:dynamin family protein [Paenibacillus sp.]
MTKKGENTVEEYIRRFGEIVEKYEEHRETLGEQHLHAITDFLKMFKQDASYILEDNRKLKIGVVGQVKAGKSTFLNALLFDGHELLPKAATPMTAALTVLTYGEKPRAEVEFFTKEEWSVLHDKALRYQELLNRARRSKDDKSSVEKVVEKSRRLLRGSQKTKERPLTEQDLMNMVKAPDDLKAAYISVAMAQESKLPIEDYLGRTEELEGFADTERLVGKLQHYVGANGKFTPIVKSTVLHIPEEMLRDMDIVDTPGVNDPILSRGQRTREYLGKCDVVFLLSYSSQFMDSVDVELFTQNIPDKGIVNVVLIGSKLDTVLLGEGHRYPSLVHALKYITDKLERQAEATVHPIIRMYPDNSVIQSLKNSLPPVFTSSMAYQIGKRMGELSTEEKHLFDNLRDTFRKDTLTPELMLELSNIEAIRKVQLPKVRAEKDQILQSRFENLLSQQEGAFSKLLLTIISEIEKDLMTIRESSGEDIERTYKTVIAVMERSRKKIDLVFDNFVTDMKKHFSSLQTDFKYAVQNYRRFDEQKESKRELVRTERYGFLWLKKRDIYETKNYTYANVHQTIDQLADLAIELERELKAAYAEMMNMEGLKVALKQAILGIHDLSDENFDFEDVITPVNKTINKISLPTFDLDSGIYRKRVTDAFGMGKVEGGNVGKLKELFYAQTDEILKDTSEKMNVKLHEVETALESISREFIDEVLAESKSKREKLMKGIKDRDEHIRKHEQLIGWLKADVGQLQR